MVHPTITSFLAWSNPKLQRINNIVKSNLVELPRFVFAFSRPRNERATQLCLLRGHPAWISIRLYVTKSSDRSPIPLDTCACSTHTEGRREDRRTRKIARSPRRRPALCVLFFKPSIRATVTPTQNRKREREREGKVDPLCVRLLARRRWFHSRLLHGQSN